MATQTGARRSNVKQAVQALHDESVTLSDLSPGNDIIRVTWVISRSFGNGSDKVGDIEGYYKGVALDGDKRYLLVSRVAEPLVAIALTDIRSIKWPQAAFNVAVVV